MTSKEYASNLLVSTKYSIVASSMFVLFILSRFSLPYKICYLTGHYSNLNYGIDTSDCIQYVHPFPVNSLENEGGNETDFQFLRYKCMSD